MIRLAVFKKRNAHIYATHLCQFKCWEYYFQAQMTVKVAKFPLVFSCK